jgi:hypothetical protein
LGGGGGGRDCADVGCTHEGRLLQHSSSGWVQPPALKSSNPSQRAALTRFTHPHRYKPGNWKEIFAEYEHVFNGRTPTDLKDKWRNIEKKEAAEAAYNQTINPDVADEEEAEEAEEEEEAETESDAEP